MRKRYVNHAALVHVADLCTSETEFSAAKAVRVNRYLRPRGNFLFQPLQMSHTSYGPLRSPLRCPRTVMRFSCYTADGAYRQPCTLVPVYVSSSDQTRSKCESLRLIVRSALLH